MRKSLPGLVLGALAVGAAPLMIVPAFAASPPAPAAPAGPAAPAAPTAPAAAKPAAGAAAHYSVETTLVGKMLDDPAANELLKKMIPGVYGNEMFHSMGRESTLKSIQQYEPEALSDANLAKIQAELNKIPAKN
jgi:para-nitrobenzyl esterase